MSDTFERLKAALADCYAIERELGAGGMATVYLAEDLKHNRKVAVKVLRPELAAALGPERFLREIKIAANLAHPHILPLHDSGEADGFLYYVMPFFEGESLRDRLLREKQMRLADVLQITREVAGALSYAHNHDVVHRDIKPENILLSSGQAVVADFGIARAVDAARGESLTETGMAIGTPAYMSPEQSMDAGTVDARSDIYALGCVVYEMLAGEQPYMGGTAQAVIAKRFATPVPHVRILRDVPERIDAAICTAMARAPIDRFDTPAQFVEALGTSQVNVTPTEGQGASAIKSIAVLPFTNISADPENEYFSDGMTEEIINALTKVSGLQVASRTSSFSVKGKGMDIREIGEKLEVGCVLEGSVRKVGNRIRITTQLINVSKGYPLWSEAYDRQLEDVFAIQDEISRAIVDALKVKLVGERSEKLVVPATGNIEAYTLYLKGRFFFNKVTESSLRTSLDLFDQALAEDPSYARAYAGIADSWSFLADDWVPPKVAYPKAKKALLSAIELDPTLPEAHTALGLVLGWHDWDFEGGVRELRPVIEQNPKDGDAHFGLGSLLPALGQLDEAIAEIRRALELDPLSASVSRWLARFLVYARQYDEAIEQSRRTLEIDPNFARAYLDMGHAHIAQGRRQEALAAYRKCQTLDGGAVSFGAFDARALAALGEKEEARAVLAGLEEQAQHRYIRAEIVAAGYAALGEVDLAFEWLDKALEARSAGLIYLAVDPAYDPLHSDPRFSELVGKVGLTV